MKQNVISALTLFAIALISALALSVVNRTTADPISLHVQNAREEALGHLGDYYYVFEVSPKGYGGEIEMLVGISSGGDVTGVAIVKMNETPGIGTKVGEPAFLGRFIGKRAGVSVGRGSNNVDAVTGATVSSRAVAAGVSLALDMYAEQSAGGEQ
ncbi:MAG: FMN-binding protein [Oscillospiraceae bacterium]|nr:FMN-binding protein [Oscillospiraceae bacterium]